MENNEVVDGLLNVSGVVEEKKETKKSAAKKATTKKATDKKTTGKKSTSKKESTVKETETTAMETKEESITTQMFIEFDGNQIDEEIIIQKVQDECKQQDVTVKDMTLYFKPEDNACYYVVNGDISGKVELF